MRARLLNGYWTFSKPPGYRYEAERPDWDVSLRPAQHEPLISLATFDRIRKRPNEGAKVPAQTDLNADFPLRGFIKCGCCGNPLTANWSKSKTGKRHAYHSCFQKGCSEARKSIRRDVLEGEFVALLKELQPSKQLLTCANDMFEALWNAQTARAEKLAASLRKRIGELDKSVGGPLGRIVDATNTGVITRYEQRIAELEREKFLTAEKLETADAPRGAYRDNFQLALRLLSNPWKLWESERLEHKRMVLKLTFANRIAYCRKNGFSNPETSSVFKALGSITTQKMAMAEGEGESPNFLFDDLADWERALGLRPIKGIPLRCGS